MNDIFTGNDSRHRDIKRNIERPIPTKEPASVPDLKVKSENNPDQSRFSGPLHPQLQIPKNAGRGTLMCVYCKQVFAKQEILNAHMDEAHRYSCLPCVKVFGTSSGLYSHKRMYHGTGGKDLLECKICGKKVLSKARLEIHERSHSESRMFQCLQCNKSYKHKYSLDMHYCSKWK